MSRTGKRGAGSLAGGSSQMMRRSKIDSGSMAGGQENDYENTFRIEKKDGQKRFMIRMGKRGGHEKGKEPGKDDEKSMVYGEDTLNYKTYN